MSIVRTLLIGAMLVWTSTGLADVLYWLVENEQDAATEYWYATNIKDGGERIQFDEAKVRGSNDYYLPLADYDGSPLDDGTIISVPAEYTMLPDTASYVAQSYDSTTSFWVELFNKGVLVASSEMNAGDLRNSGALVSSASAIVTPWTPTFTAENVPEPTSGLLALFGLAGLALRRKRCSLKL